MVLKENIFLYFCVCSHFYFLSIRLSNLYSIIVNVYVNLFKQIIDNLLNAIKPKPIKSLVNKTTLNV